MQFEQTALSREMQRAIQDMGFTEMTEVQEKTIPEMMEGKDVIAKAPTGTGKTCAFGVPIIERAIAGHVVPLAFVWKIIFTALTLEAGFKGGEIVPSFCVGAAFGCLFGQLIGLSPSLCAALGMVSVFCGVTNCPITSLLIAFELFGYHGIPFFMIAISVSYLLSGYYGLYHDQTIVYSKYKTEYINRKARD